MENSTTETNSISKTQKVFNSETQTISNSRTIYLSEDIVIKILVHVPTKALMRFRSVSKFWNSTIRNPGFAKIHSFGKGHFKGLLITDFVPSIPARGGEYRLFYADYNADNCNLCTRSRLRCYEHFSWDMSDFPDATHVVKGLIGLYNDESFTLCNVSTREMVELPSSLELDCYDYQLGYEPVEDVYKVLKVFHEYGRCVSVNTQIFTLGRGGSDLAWRSVDPSPVGCGGKSRDIDGTLYWVRKSLIPFHLTSESFETIPLPDNGFSSSDLAQIDGRPAIVKFGLLKDPVRLVIWMMKKDARGEFESWTMQICRLPMQDLLWAGTVPAGRMLVAQSPVKRDALFFFQYDHIVNEMKLIKVYGTSEPREPGVADYELIQMCYHEENIIPLAPLLSIQQQPEVVVQDSTEEDYHSVLWLNIIIHRPLLESK